RGAAPQRCGGWTPARSRWLLPARQACRRPIAGASPMDLLLWILAVMLAAVFVASGAAKLLAPREQQIERPPYVEDFPQQIIWGIGALEILGALGLLLPPLLGIAPPLASVAAAGLAITMVFAALIHLRRG